jgi:hypothetical protein
MAQGCQGNDVVVTYFSADDEIKRCCFFVHCRPLWNLMEKSYALLLFESVLLSPRGWYPQRKVIGSVIICCYNREHHAASRIQGIVRGYLSRQKFMFLVIRLRACLTIQRIVRGRLGRKRWWKFYYLRTAVVKSDTALQVLQYESKLY